MTKNIINIAININGREVIFETRNNQIFCTSLDIANVFGRRHSDILESINKKNENEGIKNFTERNFLLSSYKDKTGRTLPCYKLTRDGFSFIAMGLTGRKADFWKVSFINAFNRMESALKNKQGKIVLLDDINQEVFNLKCKTPCRSVVLEEIKQIEQQKETKCKKINEYRIVETFKNGIVKTNTEIIAEYED